MAKKNQYRLQAILNLKERAKRQSEIELARAIQLLEKERKKLKELEDEKKALCEKIRKRQAEHAEKVAMGESRIRDNEVFFNFLRKLKEDGEALDKKIDDQKAAVSRAEDGLKRARRRYIDACNELKMMEKHKELWQKKIRAALTAKENKELGELGNVIHQLKQMSA